MDDSVDSVDSEILHLYYIAPPAFLQEGQRAFVIAYQPNIGNENPWCYWLGITTLK